MDQRPNSVSQDMRDISQTRAAMAEKLEQLEERVQETVHDAKSTVLDIVDHVKDTAESFVDRAEEFVEQTKQQFDPSYQITQRPWIMLGGAIAVGYLLGVIESRQSSGRPFQRRLPYSSAEQSQERFASSGDQRNVWDGIVREVQQEIEHTKGALIEAGRSFVHDFFQQVLPSLILPLQQGGRSHTHASRTSPGETERNGSDWSRHRI